MASIRTLFAVAIPIVILVLIVLLVVYICRKCCQQVQNVPSRQATNQPLIIHQTTGYQPPQHNQNVTTHQQYMINPQPVQYPHPGGYSQQQSPYPQPTHQNPLSGGYGQPDGYSQQQHIPPAQPPVQNPSDAPPSYSECVGSSPYTQPSAPPLPDYKTAGPPPSYPD